MDGPGAGARLIVVCGLPGSGKTTLARSLERRLRAVRLAPDEWMDALSINLHDQGHRAKIETLQWTLAQDLLALGLVVILDWGTWARSDRDRLRERARAMGVPVELHYVSASLDVLFERIQRRGREDPPLTREDVTRWFDVFQAPTIEEMTLFDEPLDA